MVEVRKKFIHFTLLETSGDIRALLEDLEATRGESIEHVKNSPVMSYFSQCWKPHGSKRWKAIQKRELHPTTQILHKTVRAIEKDHPDVLRLCQELIETRRHRWTGVLAESVEHHLNKPLYRFIGEFVK